jgi:hypothetical protein
MIQIRPGEYLPISRQIADSSDSTTYYVRSYLYKRKGSIETLLDTIDLEDKGSQRFSYNYQVPQDADDYFLSIITKVFTDSGYTTLSDMYGATEETHLIAERWGLQFGGGGSANINYNRVRKIITEEIKKIEKPQPGKDVDLSVLTDGLGQVKQAISDIKIPEPKSTDLSYVIKKIDNVSEKIKAIKIPEPEKLDLSPIMVVMKQRFTDILSQIKKSLFQEGIKIQSSTTKEMREEIKKEVEKLSFNFNVTSAQKEGGEDKNKEVKEPLRKRIFFK